MTIDADRCIDERNFLVYLLVTKQCPNRCRFCMYANERKDEALELSATARCNLERLASKATRVSISGQGEPLVCPDTVERILDLPGRGRHFELITSGALPWSQLAPFLDHAERLAESHGDRLTVRLSLDRFHVESLAHNNHLELIRRHLSRPRDGCCGLSVRSLTTDRRYLRQYLSALLSGLRVSWTAVDELNELLRVDDAVIPIIYKNIVYPGGAGVKDEVPMERYIELLEKKVDRALSFGNLVRGMSKPGIDILVDSLGDVYLYGLEIHSRFNIHIDEVTHESLAAWIQGTPFLRACYTLPLLRILREARKHAGMNGIIDEVNNPFWVIKSLYARYPEHIVNVVNRLWALG
jgi:hypothetical protein